MKGIIGKKVLIIGGLGLIGSSTAHRISELGGTVTIVDNKTPQYGANNFNKQNKIIAAICIAPVTLANAGILNGKKATVFPSGKNDLIRNGAKYTGDSVTVDGNIITANGPMAAEAFGKKIVEMLK